MPYSTHTNQNLDFAQAMSDPVSGDAASVSRVGGMGGSSGERSGVDPPAGRARRRVRAGVGLALVAVVVLVIVTDSFGGSGKATAGVADNTSAISLTRVKRQSLSQQTQVSGTLGYAGSLSIRVPSGTAPFSSWLRPTSSSASLVLSG